MCNPVIGNLDGYLFGPLEQRLFAVFLLITGKICIRRFKNQLRHIYLLLCLPVLNAEIHIRYCQLFQLCDTGREEIRCKCLALIIFRRCHRLLDAADDLPLLQGLRKKIVFRLILFLLAL